MDDKQIIRGFVRLNGRVVGLSYPRSLYDRFDSFETSLREVIPVLENTTGLRCYQVFVQNRARHPDRVYAFKFMLDEQYDSGAE